MTHEKSDIKKLRVGVLMGGKNAEREVSFNSGRTICDHLDSARYEIIPIFQTEAGTLYQLPWKFLHRGKIADFSHRLDTQATKLSWDDLKSIIDFAYIAQHGRYGEDGILQGTLEVLGIPYLGSKIFGSASGMNKAFHKKLFTGAGIATPRGITLNRHDIQTISAHEMLKQLDEQNIQFPFIVKPAHEGSSLGMSLVNNPEELMPALQHALVSQANNVEVLIEEKIIGMEFVCVCLQNSDGSWFTLPITEVVPEEGSAFYDYEQKYMPGRAKKITPARCSQEILEKISTTCITATELLDFKTISRIDGFVKNDGTIVLIDPNSLTGMGPATFLFHQAAQFGMNHMQLINFLIEQELKAYGLSDKLSLLSNCSKDLIMNNQSEKKVRVGVLLGGASNEREISLESGRNVCYKLSPHHYEVTPLFLNHQNELYALNTEQLIKHSTDAIKETVSSEQKISWSSLSENFDFIFIALHGGKGENGSVQGMLEMLGIPYNGSGVLTSALCMDKFKTNEFLRTQDINTPSSLLISGKAWNKCQTLEEKHLLVQPIIDVLKFPLVLKPYDDGCSVMIAKIQDVAQLLQELDVFFTRDKDAAMLEELINGTELTCGVLGNHEITVLPPSQAVAKEGILSIKEKFLPGEGENQTPAPLPTEALALVQEVIGKTYTAAGCKGYARIDCFYQDAQQSPTGMQRVIILEINTLPGLTPATCIFHQAAEIGLKPMDFISKIIELGFENHAHIKPEIHNQELPPTQVSPAQLFFEQEQKTNLELPFEEEFEQEQELEAGPKIQEPELELELEIQQETHVSKEESEVESQVRSAEPDTEQEPAAHEHPRPQAELRAAVPEIMIMRMF